MEPQQSTKDKNQPDRVDSTESQQTKTNTKPTPPPSSSSSSPPPPSTFSSSDDSLQGSTGTISSSSSGDISASSGSSGDMPTEAAVVVPVRCVGRNNRGVSWGFTSVIGRRKEMEDAVAVVPGFMSRACEHVGGCTAPGSKYSGDVSPLHFFAVYDGHGGSQVANFCKDRMHEVIAQEWDNWDTFAIDGDGNNEWQKKWEAALSRGFERTDNEVETDAIAPDMAGSTAVVVVLTSCQIITSNCGDSRALLCRRSQTIPLSIDQKPDREDELKRIQKQGGKVINWDGARILGVLAMSRAIGDRHFRPWVIPEPEITFTTRTEEDECLILASDGLWDVMTNEEVGQVARRLLRRWRRLMATHDEISPAQAVADDLTEIACSRNSSDNISVIVIDLKARRSVPRRQ